MKFQNSKRLKTYLVAAFSLFVLGTSLSSCEGGGNYDKTAAVVANFENWTNYARNDSVDGLKAIINVNKKMQDLTDMDIIKAMEKFNKDQDSRGNEPISGNLGEERENFALVAPIAFSARALGRAIEAHAWDKNSESYKIFLYYFNEIYKDRDPNGNVFNLSKGKLKEIKSDYQKHFGNKTVDFAQTLRGFKANRTGKDPFKKRDIHSSGEYDAIL